MFIICAGRLLAGKAFEPLLPEGILSFVVRDAFVRVRDSHLSQTHGIILKCEKDFGIHTPGKKQGNALEFLALR